VDASAVATAVTTEATMDVKMEQIKEKLGLDPKDESVTAEVLAGMVPIEGSVEDKINALHAKLLGASSNVSEEDLAALREQAQAATKIQSMYRGKSARKASPARKLEAADDLGLTGPSTTCAWLMGQAAPEKVAEKDGGAEAMLPEMFASEEGRKVLSQLFELLEKSEDGLVTAQMWGKGISTIWSKMDKFFGGCTAKEVGKAFVKIGDTDVAKKLDMDAADDKPKTEAEMLAAFAASLGD